MRTGIVVWIGLACFAAACSPPSDLQLSETKAKLVTVSAGNGGAFGNVAVGATSAPIYVTVAPAGTGISYNVVNAVSESCANFSVDAVGLPAEVSRVCVDGGGGPIPIRNRESAPVQPQLCNAYEESYYDFTASFAPTVAGAQSCVVTLTLGNGTTNMVTLTGTGLPPPREIELARSSVAFGDVRRNTASSPQAIEVRNTGSEILTITSAAVTGAEFSLAGATTAIAGNSSYTYQVACSPADRLGAIFGSFIIVSNDPDEGSVSIPLSCNGVDSALDVQPSPIAMPAARVAEPRELTVTLRNSGGAAMNVTAISVTGTDLELVAAPLGEIPAAGSVPVTLRFMAREEAEINGMLSVQFDGLSRTIPISARARLAAMSISPDGEADLGAVCIGSTKDKAFKVLGTGGAGFAISNVVVSGDGLALTSPPGPLNVEGAGASTATLTVRAMPTLPGPIAGTLELTTDIPNDPARIVKLTASAIAQGVGAAPAEFDFSSVQVNEPSTAQSISIANCGGGDLSIISTALEGVDAGDFRIITEPARTIAATETASLLIEMRPRSVGAKSATLVITHSSGTTSVPLLGDGFVLATPVERIGTYYSCSTGNGDGGWMVSLCLLALCWSRRRRR